MSKELARLLRREHASDWETVKNQISQMTWQDFAVTYDKSTPYHDIPLFAALRKSNVNSSVLFIELAELIIKKNPVFAAKIVDDFGYMALHHACASLAPHNAFRIVNLLIPYMSKEDIVSIPKSGASFLQLAAQVHHYKVAALISPELLTIMLKKSSGGAAVDLIKFLREAVDVYDVEISVAPEVADNHFRKGILLQTLNKQEKAIKCYKKAIELDHTYADKIEGIELSTLAAPVVSVVATTAADDREAMKAKISELTQELSKLLQKTTVLAEEVTFLRGSLKVVEEHKGQAPAEPPSYEEEAHIEAPALPASLPLDIALMGSVDTCDVTLHYDS